MRVTQKKIYKIRLKKGDNVIVRSGKFKGRTGKITAVHPTLNKVTIEGLNIVKKHVKPTQTKPTGGIVELTRPLAVSKVAILEPTSKKPSRIGYSFAKDGSKIRIYKRTSKEIK